MEKAAYIIAVKKQTHHPVAGTGHIDETVGINRLGIAAIVYPLRSHAGGNKFIQKLFADHRRLDDPAAVKLH